MSGGAVQVRRAELGDAEVMARLLHDFTSEFGDPTPPLDVLAANLRDVLAGGHFWALLAGDPVQGILTVAERPTAFSPGAALYLEDLYVEPAHRGQGMGGALMARLFEEAAERQASLVEIGVDESDVDAMRFYERHGMIHRDPESGERAFYIYREF